MSGRRIEVPAADWDGAVKIYRDFREKTPTKIAVAHFAVPRAVACIGHVESIDYRTTHGKKLALYRHDFAAGSRPLFCVSADGSQLLLLGGRFKFTERGIVDRDRHGNEIENTAHGLDIDD